MNIAEEFQRAEQFFFDGKLKECADLCQKMLEVNPNFAHGYYLMGALFKTTGNFSKAIQFSDLAIKHAPNVATFYLQRGHSQFIIDDIAAARISLEQAVKLDPKMAISQMLLADVYAKLKMYDKAVEYFNRARALEDIPEIDEHHGLCLHMKGDLAGAEVMLKKVVARRPEYDWGYIHLGKVQLERGDIAEAEQNLNKALSNNPFAYEAMLALAQVYKGRGDNDGAIHLATNAARVNPNIINPYLVLGELYYLSSKLLDSEQMYRRALEIDADNIFAQSGLSITLVNLRKTDEALEFLDKVLAKKPDDVSAQYLKAALTGRAIATAPQGYVARLFDDYADRFDIHLQQSLSYNTPQVLAACVKDVLGVAGKPMAGLSLLDLGCGTGLGAEALKDITTKRVGVDLSAKMIEKAIAKQLYNDTHVADIVEFADNSPAIYDMVAAVDVLVYIGDLESLFRATKKSLRPSGIFAFSVENGDDSPPYRLDVSARYAHAADYIRSLAEKHGFILHKELAVTLRKDRNQPIEGYIYVLEKPAVN